VILTQEKDGILNFYAINDELKKFDDVQLELEINRFNGENLITTVSVADGKDLNEMLKFDPVRVDELIENSDKNKVFLNLIVRGKNENVIAENNYFFSKPKDLKLPKPNIKIKKISPTEIEISTDVLAKDVYLMGDTHFSDNFFDLLPKTSKRIRLSKPLEKVEVMSLWDTIKTM
jgi:beta-mannosidase